MLEFSDCKSCGFRSCSRSLSIGRCAEILELLSGNWNTLAMPDNIPFLDYDG